MRRYITNKNFLPNNIKSRKEQKSYEKYLTLVLVILNLLLIPLNIEIVYERSRNEEVIPVYEEVEEYLYYNEIQNIIEILNENFSQANIINNKGQIITDSLEIIYKLEEEEKIEIKSIRKEEKLGYVLEVEL